eukprot:IDg23078t1
MYIQPSIIAPSCYQNGLCMRHSAHKAENAQSTARCSSAGNKQSAVLNSIPCMYFAAAYDHKKTACALDPCLSGRLRGDKRSGAECAIMAPQSGVRASLYRCTVSCVCARTVVPLCTSYSANRHISTDITWRHDRLFRKTQLVMRRAVTARLSPPAIYRANIATGFASLATERNTNAHCDTKNGQVRYDMARRAAQRHNIAQGCNLCTAGFRTGLRMRRGCYKSCSGRKSHFAYRISRSSGRYRSFALLFLRSDLADLESATVLCAREEISRAEIHCRSIEFIPKITESSEHSAHRNCQLERFAAQRAALGRARRRSFISRLRWDQICTNNQSLQNGTGVGLVICPGFSEHLSAHITCRSAYRPRNPAPRGFALHFHLKSYWGAENIVSETTDNFMQALEFCC